ncbi:MAG: hypothetical protein ISR65_10860 [Bacteriovoracaceae bacterium]|nr:hypothetical protein [Bacteriovoracaceae bacterium]
MRLLLLVCILALPVNVALAKDIKVNELVGQYKLISGTKKCFQEISISEGIDCFEVGDIQVEQLCHINQGIHSSRTTEKDDNLKKVTTVKYRSELFNYNVLNVTNTVSIKNSYGFLIRNTIVNKVFKLRNNRLEYMVTKSDTAVFALPEYEITLCSYEVMEE